VTVTDPNPPGAKGCRGEITRNPKEVGRDGLVLTGLQTAELEAMGVDAPKRALATAESAHWSPDVLVMEACIRPSCTA
jgi:hypothetical protein